MRKTIACNELSVGAVRWQEGHNNQLIVTANRRSNSTEQIVYCVGRDNNCCNSWSYSIVKNRAICCKPEQWASRQHHNRCWGHRELRFVGNNTTDCGCNLATMCAHCGFMRSILIIVRQIARRMGNILKLNFEIFQHSAYQHNRSK